MEQTYNGKAGTKSLLAIVIKKASHLLFSILYTCSHFCKLSTFSFPPPAILQICMLPPSFCIRFHDHFKACPFERKKTKNNKPSYLFSYPPPPPPPLPTSSLTKPHPSTPKTTHPTPTTKPHPFYLNYFKDSSSAAAFECFGSICRAATSNFITSSFDFLIRATPSE